MGDDALVKHNQTDGQRTDDRTDDGTHGFRGGFISHPDVYRIVYVHGRDKNSRLYLEIIKYDPNIMYQQRCANNSNMK